MTFAHVQDVADFLESSSTMRLRDFQPTPPEKDGLTSPADHQNRTAP